MIVFILLYPFCAGKITAFYSIPQAYCIKFALFYAVKIILVNIDG